MRVRVAIIGAGPAGASCALSLSQAGIDNVLIDRKRTPGSPVQCAEFVPIEVNRYIPLSKIPAAVNQAVGFMDVDTGRKTYGFDGKGYVLNRDLFDEFIVRSAQEKGTVLLSRTAAVKVIPGINTVVVKDLSSNALKDIGYSYLVIASGPRNSLHLGRTLENSSYVSALQVRTGLMKKLDRTICYFRNYIPWGYGWVFPKGDFANAGMGIVKSMSLVSLSLSLGLFLKELKESGVINGEIYGRTSGLIPVSGMNGLYAGNIALCGDAAGLAHPVTGAGILNAIISGRMLGEFIAEGMGKSVNTLKDYSEEMKSIYLGPLAVAAEKRNIIYKRITGGEETDSLIKYLWPSFNEYYDIV